MGDGVLSETFPEIRDAVRRLCAKFPGEYWQQLDRERAYPTEFVTALTEAGFLSVLIPEEFDGSGLGLEAACAVLEEIHRSGSNGGASEAGPVNSRKTCLPLEIDLKVCRALRMRSRA